MNGHFGETHRSTRIPLNPLAIARKLCRFDHLDRRFLVPAATVSLIIGGLFAMFSATPRVLIEGLHFSPIELGCFRGHRHDRIRGGHAGHQTGRRASD